MKTMKFSQRKLLVLSLAITGLYSLIFISNSFSQTTSEVNIKPSSVDLKQIIQSVEPLIDVEYQSQSLAVIKAEEDTLLIINGTLSSFWHAIDIAKSHGYSLDEITNSGMGSQGNPTRFYAIMSQ
jgi:hypothetical protein